MIKIIINNLIVNMDYSKKIEGLENEIKHLSLELNKNNEIIQELVECAKSMHIESMHNLSESARRVLVEK